MSDIWRDGLIERVRREVLIELLLDISNNDSVHTYRSPCCVECRCPWCLTGIKVFLVLRSWGERGMAGWGGNHHEKWA